MGDQQSYCLPGSIFYSLLLPPDSHGGEPAFQGFSSRVLCGNEDRTEFQIIAMDKVCYYPGQVPSLTAKGYAKSMAPLKHVVSQLCKHKHTFMFLLLKIIFILQCEQMLQASYTTICQCNSCFDNSEVDPGNSSVDGWESESWRY